MNRNHVSDGYLVVKTFARLYQDAKKPSFENTPPYSVPVAGRDASEVSRQYRGIDREPLSGFTLSQLARMARATSNRSRLLAQAPARLALGQLTQGGRASEGFLQRLEDAQDLLSIVADPTDREIIWARQVSSDTRPPRAMQRLGYDPTWFIGNHFSALCDCMHFPRWHGTDAEGVLFREHYSRLNAHGLFETAEHAEQFLAFYLSQEWTEGGEYVLAEIWSLPPDLSELLVAPPVCEIFDDDSGTLVRKSWPRAVTYDLTLVAHQSERRVQAVSVLKQLLALSLAKANALTKDLPKKLRVVYLGDIEHLAEKLRAAGLTIVINPLSGDHETKE